MSKDILAETYLSTNFLERFGQTKNANISSDVCVFLNRLLKTVTHTHKLLHFSVPRVPAPNNKIIQEWLCGLHRRASQSLMNEFDMQMFPLNCSSYETETVGIDQKNLTHSFLLYYRVFSKYMWHITYIKMRIVKLIIK